MATSTVDATWALGSHITHDSDFGYMKRRA
ncbi:uncharacterized protein G2W53_012774 [Senna tora]|uniref:Uncharacterized protein n=1 Tax=Senna tora TaxID=362788 RepID=A0A834U1C3_9FABA|nr:uncharacterized protein G2W53_012774 [Senna tora]